MDAIDLIIFIEVVLTLLFIISAFLLVKGVINGFRHKVWKPFIWGISLLILTFMLFFVLNFTGQILSIDTLPMQDLPTLKDSP